ncbi:MAG TPA: cytochrome c [Thermoanaerobaculia bacterium]|nr:cytochrome c [Thermoanaerobaculia bacterium]
MNARKIETGFISAAVAFLLIVLVSGCDDRTANANTIRPQLPEATDQLRKTRVERGKYLVTIMVCNDCHTPFKMGPAGPEPDMTRMLSGHPQSVGKVPPPKFTDGSWVWAGGPTNTVFHGPWGTSYTANITPDRNTGIGIWDEALFIKAIRTGKHWGTSRPIMPPMPWRFFSQASDEDLKSIYAYLRTIKPIQNQVPDYEPPPAPAPAKANEKKS